MSKIYIISVKDVEPYSPPGHTGTVNWRLIGEGSIKSTRVEIVLGQISRGGEAMPHAHDEQEQFIFVLAGEGIIVSDGDEKKLCGGSLAYIPVGVEHSIIAQSDHLKIMIIYSPPLTTSPDSHQNLGDRS